jgi:hypothetical protein
MLTPTSIRNAKQRLEAGENIWIYALDTGLGYLSEEDQGDGCWRRVVAIQEHWDSYQSAYAVGGEGVLASWYGETDYQDSEWEITLSQPIGGSTQYFIFTEVGWNTLGGDIYYGSLSDADNKPGATKFWRA